MVATQRPRRGHGAVLHDGALALARSSAGGFAPDAIDLSACNGHVTVCNGLTPGGFAPDAIDLSDNIIVEVMPVVQV